jgi:uncharacterized protein (DUF2126 family)/transglutaminase-like putative cysteine protease
MAIRVALNHRTVYRYDRLVKLSPQIIRLRPAPHCRTPILSYSLKVHPAKHFLNWQQDPQANYLARAVFPDRVQEFSVEVDLVADMTVINPFDFFLEEQAESFPFAYDPWLEQELAPFLRTEPVGPHLANYLSTIDRTTPRHTVNFLVALNQRLQNDISYLIRLEPGVQAPDYTLENRSGSCRDSAWLLVQIMRNLGLASRFVSGYLIQLKPDVKSLDGPVGASQDFTDLHAWCEVYLPGAGWIGLDPTSGLLAGEGHLPVAASPEPASSAPITGAVDPCEVEFDHAMSVTRVHEDPRVTKPYSDEQWTAIETLGRHIDKDLQDNDVRLTMGGEPTFVGAEEVDEPEWNNAALGPRKRKLAGDLISRLRARQKPGSFLHFGQGKWYPGEPLPRWALTCYWRKDGQPIWRNPEWIADDQHAYSFTTADAEVYMRTLAKNLAVEPDLVNAAYEDPIPYVHKEGQLPVNVSPLDSKLDTPEDRDRLRRVFERGLGQPSGFVLPLAPRRGLNGPLWQSGIWMLRSRHLFLLPGDSPVGLRLPLSALPWSEEIDPLIPVDPFAPRRALPFSHAAPPRPLTSQAAVSVTVSTTSNSQEIAEQTPSDSVVRTALCVEARNSRLHIFMPPLARLEDYLDLLRRIEDTSIELSMPIVIEGYTPPYDPRIESVKVTPDPGVIEINVPPVRTWDEAVEQTTALYDDAHHSRLRAEKFMLDGRHTGTGGGNHIVLGAANAADSPMLRRPDLLRSALTYWNNHPSLSYLFSGMFIGPTSQAPRVDETRKDALYELEIAFRQVPAAGAEVPPWLVDRLFRHLLVDGTGNTHRAEFCIDKLYSPDSSTGRLGLLELRAFEMPPHARMSLAQQLLLRALISWFWKTPYVAELVHWETRLHDRFMLPHYIEQDFHSVLADLRASGGYAFDPAWYAPFTEFRYPVYGRVNYDGIEIELRQATEPWYVLGEEPAGGGTARYVDSSVERLQVKVKGMLTDRYIVTCNGQAVPLASTGTHGEAVAGVRYRAWQPPSCLHPTIPVQSPLIFDLVDTWSKRSIGGCTYHVAHPAGRNYETFPVNSYEAEARRLARFQSFGHTPGPMAAIPQLLVDPRFPCTLDLRRFA